MSILTEQKYWSAVTLMWPNLVRCVALDGASLSVVGAIGHLGCSHLGGFQQATPAVKHNIHNVHQVLSLHIECTN